MRNIFTALFALSASPALAASGPFFSLGNTNFVVLIAFLIFVGILMYMKVPGSIGGMLDKRADSIKAELDEAKALRDEAQSLLASYERKQKEVAAQAERIVASAKDEATKAAAEAKKDIATSITRRLAAAEEQIASAQAAAVKDVRDQAIVVAVGAAKDVIAKQMDAKSAGTLIDDSIATVADKLH
ncbi:ATP synthase F0 subcomplex B subunit [Yoonia tamlensis]|uniref:ATP synthase subunit b n=1 Tax=Yoonia tamlensis TaxID=390270 RepID=A0A1I6GUX6_9RHOB|nr:F0F1 ATP synthase subunit B [Yoonia tamlensis]SFR45901.1 ATP synthase F0 subcomplex B subunit [Yoonia tamlensis]